MIPVWTLAGALICSVGGCAARSSEPAATPKARTPETEARKAVASAQSAPAAAVAPGVMNSAGHQAPESVAIGALQVSETTPVRVRGYVKEGIWLRLVPRRTVFMVGDRSGSAMALIKGKVDIALGMRIEAVGYYREIPSPVYAGPATPPAKKVLVIERFLKL